MSTPIALTALSPLDGRYHTQLQDLAPLFSEFGLLKRRVHIEVEYLVFLADQQCIPHFTPDQVQKLRAVPELFSLADAEQIKEIEKKTHHDVKAVEYFLRQKLTDENLPNGEFLHLAMTSEDVNGLAYSLMIKDGVTLLQNILRNVEQQLAEMIHQYVDLPLLARTHGQEAVPTTVGKELAVFALRLLDELQVLDALELEGKLTGAVGNFNAHVVAFPTKNWQELSTLFVTTLGLKPNLFTTQILPTESYERVFASLQRINGILLDFNQDLWRYISDHIFGQKVSAQQVGSSTMPQKINPIDFENSEGNLGLANALLTFFIQKLPVSRLQRDLSDSTVKRSIGSAFGYCQLAYLSLLKGLQKLTVNEPLLQKQLSDHWEVLAEAYQVILRAEGDAGAYEVLRQHTQGKQLSHHDHQQLIEALPASPETRARLAQLSPASYIGLAPVLAREAVQRITHYLQGVS